MYQIKAKRLNYLIKDFFLSNFKMRLRFLLSNSEVSLLNIHFLFIASDWQIKDLKKGVRNFPISLCNSSYVSFFA